MASIIDRPNGNRWIQIVGLNGKRQTVRLGKATAKTAKEVCGHIEALHAAAVANHSWDQETAKWVSKIGGSLHDKLAAVGLVPTRDAVEPTKLEAFIDDCINSRKDVKTATRVVWRLAKRGLVNFFGADRELSSITAGDADDYKQSMVDEPLAGYTIRKRLEMAKRWFKSAKRKRLISENPFDEVSIKASMPDKMHFITLADAQALIDACPNHDWRMIVALSRFGGLRCPSEVLSLRWQDVDWERQLIEVQSPKTEHHEGGASRTVPLFPELYEHLRTSFERAPEGAVYVVNEQFRKSATGKNGWVNCNLRTTFAKIITRAGLKQWPRIFHNLRSSRQTELEDRFPSHVVCAWMGNSEKIARRHYLQVTADHVQRALEGALVNKTEAKQKAKQSGAAKAGKEVLIETATSAIAEENANLPVFASQKVDDEGLEPPTPSV